ncbi:MAG: putative beta-lysine N-acetyltransferase [Chitinivibrionales bacterium]|nr:putative beta-lysine N-acetyltransferase [Chitinivibrionales bacterium]MBD3356014.1 putative beta-lysine N-acetyltransferase [Chitinivibrionales bacterium]
MKPDTVTKLKNSLIQHGPLSSRIYLMKLDAADLPGIIDELDVLAHDNEYGKIFAKIPTVHEKEFTTRGYVVEAEVPRFFGGKTTLVMVSKFKDTRRAESAMGEKGKHIVEQARQAAKNPPHVHLRPEYTCAACTGEDVDEMAAIYRQVFESYPFPILDPSFLRAGMAEDTAYYGVRHEGRLVALASAEIDREDLNAELTDFATIPEYRRKGLARYLLDTAEEHLRKIGIIMGYTIARAASRGMNTVFAQRGYAYGGTLVRNTNICGRIEDMNVWYKPL